MMNFDPQTFQMKNVVTFFSWEPKPAREQVLENKSRIEKIFEICFCEYFSHNKRDIPDNL